MQQIGDVERHFWITRSVARVMGVSLSDAMREGKITAQDYAAIVTKCRNCANAQRCQEWLAACQSITRSAPPDCVNGNLLEWLARPH